MRPDTGLSADVVAQDVEELRGNSIALAWGRGIGKSWFTRFCMLSAVARWDGKLIPSDEGEGQRSTGIRIVLLMPTLGQFKKVHHKALKEDLEGTWAKLGGVYNQTDFRITFPGGSWIQIVSCEQRDNVRGIRADMVVGDEGDDIDIETYDAIVTPWLSEPHSLRLSVVVGTPRRGRGGLLYRQFRFGNSTAPEHSKFFASHATYRDAPEYVSQAAVDAARAVATPQLFAREWECNFDSAEGLVYSLFDEAFHVRPPAPKTQWTEFLVGVDHGYEDPGVFLLIGVCGNGKDARCHVLKEISAQHKTEGWWVSHIATMHDAAKALAPNAPVRWYCDPSQPARVEALKKAGARTQTEIINRIEDGVQEVSERFYKRPMPDTGNDYARLYIDPSCKGLITELGKYKRKRDRNNPDVVTDDIIDKNNHFCFPAGTSVATARGPVPIEHVTTSDEVMTRGGWRPVTKTWEFRSAAIWRLHMTDGSHLDATPDHRIWTEENGWMSLDTLRYGLTLVRWESGQGSLSIGSSFKGSLTDDTRTPGDLRIDGTSAASQPADAPIGIYTERSGRPRTVQSRQTTTSTMWTRTRSTTTSPTFSASSGSTTFQAISPSGTRRIESSPRPVSQRFDISRLHGTEAPRGERGIRSMADSHGLGECQFSEPVSNAQSHLAPSLAGSPIDSARTIASRPGEERPASTRLTEYALDAAGASESTNTERLHFAPSRAQVARVEDLGLRTQVLCLSVEEHHEFFANGVLVANCDSLRYPLATRFLGQTGQVKIGQKQILPF